MKTALPSGLLFGIIFLIASLSFAQGTLETLGDMPEKINKTSGLIFYKDKLITHNDSGNTNTLFEMDTVSLMVTREIHINNASNIDWEDIDQDATYIYIGDFGNFFGDREDLVVYRIKKEEYDSSDSVNAERIDFHYEDQSGFTRADKSDWDAEAFFVLDSDLVVLTKQWRTKGTVAYRFPKIPGSHTARAIGTYNVNGLVTGASRNTLGDLVLSGYSEFLEPFLVYMETTSIASIFGTRQNKFPLGAVFAQIEGVTFINDSRCLVSSEFFENDSPRITLLSKLFAYRLETETGGPADEVPKRELIIYRENSSSFLNYELNRKGELFARAIYDLSGKQVYFKKVKNLRDNTIDLSFLEKSVYFLTFYYDNGIVSKPFFWN